MGKKGIKNMDIRKTVEDLKNEYNLNGKEFAEMIGVHPSVMSILRQRGVATERTLRKIQETFDLREKWWMHEYIYPLDKIEEREKEEEEATNEPVAPEHVCTKPKRKNIRTSKENDQKVTITFNVTIDTVNFFPDISHYMKEKKGKRL